MAGEEHVGIFWDYENCSPSSRSVSPLTGYELVSSIRDAVHEFGPIKLFKAYSEPPLQTSLKATCLRSELQSSGVSLTDCPHNGQKEVADKMLIVDMMAYAIDNPAPGTLVLITGDKDFAYAVSVLRLRKYRVVLISPTAPKPHPTLKAHATLYLDWNIDILGRNKPPSPVGIVSVEAPNEAGKAPKISLIVPAESPKELRESHIVADISQPPFSPHLLQDAATFSDESSESSFFTSVSAGPSSPIIGSHISGEGLSESTAPTSALSSSSPEGTSPSTAVACAIVVPSESCAVARISPPSDDTRIFRTTPLSSEEPIGSTTISLLSSTDSSRPLTSVEESGGNSNALLSTTTGISLPDCPIPVAVSSKEFAEEIAVISISLTSSSEAPSHHKAAKVVIEEIFESDARAGHDSEVGVSHVSTPLGVEVSMSATASVPPPPEPSLYPTSSLLVTPESLSEAASAGAASERQRPPPVADKAPETPQTTTSISEKFKDLVRLGGPTFALLKGQFRGVFESSNYLPKSLLISSSEGQGHTRGDAIPPTSPRQSPKDVPPSLQIEAEVRCGAGVAIAVAPESQTLSSGKNAMTVTQSASSSKLIDPPQASPPHLALDSIASDKYVAPAMRPQSEVTAFTPALSTPSRAPLAASALASRSSSTIQPTIVATILEKPAAMQALNIAPSTAPVPSTSKIPGTQNRQVPPQFVPLAQVLAGHRVSGVLKPITRTVLAAELVKKDPKVYRQAGLGLTGKNCFKKYIKMASDKGIITCGGAGANEWISLHPGWENVAVAS